MQVCSSELTDDARLVCVLKSSDSLSAVLDSDSDDDDNPDKRMIRLSFRKGGDKVFYSVLRRSLLGKAWEVCATR